MTVRTPRKSKPDALPGETPADLPTHSELRAFALGLLARREYGQSELTSRLRRKWNGGEGLDETVEACVEELVREGLVSDRRYAESFVRARRQKCQGPVKIRAELQRRQVDPDAVDASLPDEDDDWIELAVHWLQRQGVATPDRALKAKYYRRLLNRGFRHGQAMAALDRCRGDDPGGVSVTEFD